MASRTAPGGGRRECQGLRSFHAFVWDPDALGALGAGNTARHAAHRGGLLCLALPGRAEAAVAPPYAYLQITSNSYPDGVPVVSQGRVAWIGEDKSGFGLMVYDSLTGVTKNVSPHVSEYSNHPVLAGDLVAWSSNSGGENQIHAFGLTTGVERLVATPQDDNEELSTDGRYVAWYDRATPGAPADIYLWDSSGGARKITNDPLDDYGPQVSDGYVVWMRESATDPAIS